MAEEVQAFFRADGPQDGADSSPKTWNCSLCGFAQERFEFAEDLFDRVEVRRICRQKKCCRIRSLDRFHHAGHFVSRKVIHDDDVAAPERWSQTLFDIGEKYLSVDRAINHEGCHYSVMAQAGYQRAGFPMSMRNATHQPFTARATAPQPHHVGAGGGFVDEYQPGRVEHELLSPPASACAGHVRPLLFRGAQAFF